MLIFLLPCLFIGISAVDWDVVTPLDEYVHSDDGAYEWREIASYDFPESGVTVYIINMTSQFYQDDSFSSQPIWWHIMSIAIPDEIRYLDAGAMLIDGGSNNPDRLPPGRNDTEVIGMVAAANISGIICADLKQVPNQPIVFKNDPSQRSRSEDRIIAWTWRTYLDAPENEKDPTLILRMPMTKAAKRGLDTITAVAKQRRPETDIQRFLVYGASKRGWTTWSLAATDRRVIAMAPMVFSLLDLNTTMMWHYQNMDGAYSFAMQPYYDEDLTTEFFNPETEGVYAVEDMINYKERYTMPILEIVSSGDEFFLCDENWAWWRLIPSQQKYLMMLPNAEHSMAPHYVKMVETIMTFWLNVLDDVPMPKLSWNLNWTPGGGSIDLYTDIPPRSLPIGFSAVTLGNDTRRDWRLAALNDAGNVVLHPVRWRRDLDVIDLGDGHYHVEAEEVDDEWRGFFLQGTWEGRSGIRDWRLVFTTQVNVIPNTRPHKECVLPSECKGYLV
jgi:PhoPQ-activated pathogenicity-related protein